MFEFIIPAPVGFTPVSSKHSHLLSGVMRRAARVVRGGETTAGTRSKTKKLKGGERIREGERER